MQWFISLCGWQQALIATGFTWLLTALGSSLVFFYRQVGDKTFVFMLSSAAGIMLASSFFSLLLPAIELSDEYAFIKVSVGFIVGGIIIVVSDMLTGVINRNKNAKKRRLTVMTAAVTVHNIPEGMAIGVAFGAGGNLSALMLAIGIGIQNFPEGMCVSLPFRASGASRIKSFFIGQASGVVEIFAGVLGAVAVGFVGELLPWALSFSAGAMIAVVCSELIPESFEKSKLGATLGVILGFTLMMVLDVALG